MSEKIHDFTGQNRSLDDYASAMNEALKRGGGGGTFDGGGADMETRVAKLEDAFTSVKEALLRMDARFDRVDARFDAITADTTAIKVSQAKTEERMERVMDKARDMPTETRINGMLNHKLTILGILSAIAFGLLAYLKM